MKVPMKANTQKQDKCSALEVHGLVAGHHGQGLFAGSRHVLIDGVDLTVHSGEIVGILGANGSGKSTFLLSLVDKHHRFAGDVLLGGHPLRIGAVAYVPQAPAGSLSPWLRVADEIGLPLRIRGVKESERSKIVNSLIARRELYVPLDRRVSALSGGQRVKVALLRALAVPDYQVAILDEPFEGLDEASRYTLQRAIRSLAETGVPVLITSHRAEDLDAVGARKLVLNGSPTSHLVPENECAVPRLEQAKEETKVTGNGDSLSQSTVIRANERTDRHAAALRGIAGIILGLLVWASLAAVLANPSLLPGPWRVSVEAYKLITEWANAVNVLATIASAFIWWAIANAIAIPTGLLFGYRPNAYQFIAPWLSVGRCLPIFALLGVAKSAFPGSSSAQSGFLIWLTVFLISLHSLSVSAAMAPRRRMNLAAIYGASHTFRLTRILPFECMSGLFAALEVTLPLSVIVTIVVGMFIFPEYGLALDIFNNMDKPDLSKLFACVIVPAIAAAGGLVVLRVIARKYRFEL